MIATPCWKLCVSHPLNPQQQTCWQICLFFFFFSFKVIVLFHPTGRKELVITAQVVVVSGMEHQVQKILLLQETFKTWADVKCRELDHCRHTSEGGGTASFLSQSHNAGHMKETWTRSPFKMEHGKQCQ